MNYETLKAAVAGVIKTNGNEEITGQLLQDVLMAIINALGSGYQFMGIATAETTPGTPDQRVFYLAGSAGSTVLPGFSITVDHEICVLMYSDEWEKQTLLQFDSALTSGSQNLVTSGMVYNAVTNLSQAIDSLAQVVGDHTTAIELLQETVDGHTTEIETLQGTVGDHTTAINDLQDAVVSIQAAIESLQTDVAHKIDKSDADSLVVGSAQGMLATSAVEAFFLFQQSGATGNGAALIPTIKGKTIAWNQLVPIPSSSASKTQNGVTFIDNRDGSYTVSTDANGATAQTRLDIPIGEVVGNSLIGHTLFMSGCPAGGSTESYSLRALSGNNDVGDGVVFTPMATLYGWPCIYIASGTVITTPIVFRPQIIDLSLAGLSDKTLAQIKALYSELYYAPNPGILKNNDAVAMMADGFNQWDEQWEQGSINNDGTPTTALSYQDRIRSKNFNPVFPNTVYYGKIPVGNMTIHFYDSNKNHISEVSPVVNATFTTPANCAYFKLRTTATYGNVYNNDICINISNPDKNGTYEPYWTRTSNLGLTGITGIPEGGTEDDRITIFPDGLGGAGSAFDSIFVENGVTKARKTMLEEVDLGELDWVYNGAYGFNSSGLVGRAADNGSTAKANICCSIYSVNTYTNVAQKTADMQIALGGYTPGAVILVNNNAYTSATTFKAAMSGVKLIAEAANPIVYTDLQYADGTPFIMPQMFRTAQGGTMLIVSPEGATEPSAPFSADIIYPVDPIASSGASLKNLLEALKTATVITSYTMTFNSTTQQYEFTIVK